MEGFGFYKIKEKSRGPPIIEKKSKFIATAVPVRSISEIEEAVKEIKKEMKKATHNAFAYRIVDENGISEDWDDDGEVKGCAGKPILNILQGFSVFNTLLIVTRYYGRIHLGPAGLIRQYSNTAKDLIERVGLKELNEN
ncbi:MAG: IMPACT family member YigZ [Candidatus Heimdallarchaeota archaeon LC_2]|nr:MAG: IMPACT family member YigZ [Candidatus Heimdallarchaeota archaeon LC_2]